EITLYIAIVMESIALIFRLLFLKKLINFPIYTFIKEIIFKNIIIVILSISLPLSIRNILDVSTLRLLIIVVLSLIWSALIIYLIGLNKKEKTIIKKGIQKVLSRSQI
ncbi:MAG: lipopolysaccharide biosynthesis protein, partial [Clostridia bacterium]|nr:lipopolysaccharide biosynthesis protein [Tissierellia bacterium]MDD4376477.1 lipopolysaccharide biosynthesis protein [Clostridia bacterium]